LQLVSGVPAGLGEVGVIKAKSRIYILLHGAFMIGAWICAASLGIIMARSGTIQRRQLKPFLLDYSVSKPSASSNFLAV
jgi:hypothetical protein